MKKNTLPTTTDGRSSSRPSHRNILITGGKEGRCFLLLCASLLKISQYGHLNMSIVHSEVCGKSHNGNRVVVGLILLGFDLFDQ